MFFVIITDIQRVLGFSLEYLFANFIYIASTQGQFKYEENQMLLRHILRFVIFVSGPWKHNAIEICIILIHHNALFVNNFLAHTVQMFQFQQSCL